MSWLGTECTQTDLIQIWGCEDDIMALDLTILGLWATTNFVIPTLQPLKFQTMSFGFNDSGLERKKLSSLQISVKN